MDAERLLYRLNCGKQLRPTELKSLVTRLEQDLESGDVCLDDHYIMLLVLRRAKATEYRALLERYLLIRDPMTGCLVLETLCRDWGFIRDYLERVINLALGVPWDVDDDMRLCAIELLSDFLRCRNGEDGPEYQAAVKKVVQLLLRTVELETESRQIREAAFASLVEAAEVSKILPTELSQIDFSSPSTDQRLREAVQSLLSSELASSGSVVTPSASRFTGSPGIR